MNGSDGASPQDSDVARDSVDVSPSERSEPQVAGDAVADDSLPLPQGVPLQENAVPTIRAKLKSALIGKPRDLEDQSIFRHVTLVAFLAWVGLGADGLSSSCYGPPEAFQHPAIRIWRSSCRWRRSSPCW
jgi:hypothetical protein